MLTRNRNRQGSSILSDETAPSLAPAKCRICLKDGNIPIFGEDDLSDKVMEFGCIEIGYLDRLPQHLCNTCYSLLNAAILFRKTAKESEEVLKNAEYLEHGSLPSDDLNSNIVESLNDTDNESFIKREYLEYNDTSDTESELDWKCESEYGEEALASMTQSEEPDNRTIEDDNDFEMQLLNIKEEEEEDENNDIDNELVMIIVSDKDKANKTSFSCAKCNLTFDSINDFEKHDKEIHPNKNVKKCDICNELVDKNNYKIHIKQHREKYKEQHRKKYGKVECEFCGKTVNKSYYKYHMKMHGTAEEQAERFIECSMCKKSFSAHYFSDHMKRVHDKNQKIVPKTKSKQKQLKCPVCDKMVIESTYKDHLAKHGGSTKRYICDQCGKVFKHPSAFKTHTLTHGSELKYKCQFCPYRGLHQALLKIHVRTHTGDYNYKCTECPARFITKSNLSKHLLRHQGACKFKCDTCNKGFYSKRDVDKHVKTVHLDLKTNVCEICGKGFGHRDNMLSHQLKVHKREKITHKKGRIPNYLKEEMKKSSET